MTVKTLDELRGLTCRVLANANTSPGNAAAVADALVAAEADGMPSHGMSRLVAYAGQAASGKVDGQAVPELSQPKPAVIKVDARSGFAYPAMNMGLDTAIDVAPEVGAVAVGIANSHHSGVAGHPVERLARAGLIGLFFCNGPAGLAPWQGNRALYGTNPMAFACPVEGREPLVIDLSLSKVARGKVKLAADRGEPIPEGWAVDAEGKPTTDAAAGMAGWMVPAGDAKGAALALVVELLAAGLTGSCFGFEASSFFTAEGAPPNVGQFFLVLDPEAFGGPVTAERIATLIQAIDEQPDTRIPGQRRFELRAKAHAEGVDVPDGLLGQLEAMA
ncbi:MAG: Ldh family oxidoreductase [Magnetovibrio sp.]|nr:Ldh family oxidoreductase [Magnetovibrio sp.]